MFEQRTRPLLAALEQKYNIMEHFSKKKSQLMESIGSSKVFGCIFMQKLPYSLVMDLVNRCPSSLL